jgi:hypothetical protein
VRKAAQARIAALEAVQEDSQSQKPPRGPKGNETAQLPIANEIEVGLQQEDLKRDPGDGEGDEAARSEDQDPAEVEVGSPNRESRRTLRSQQQPLSSSPRQDNLVPSSPTAVQSEDKRRFYRDLQDYLEVQQTQMYQPFAMWPTIQGHTFEIWDLWRVTISQKVEPAERDWQLVAENLGYNWIELPTVPDDIRRCYEAQLAHFEEVMTRFDEYSDEDADEVENEIEPDTPIREPQTQLKRGQGDISQAPYNSSPPQQPSLKRKLDSTLPADHIYPESSRKRLKVSKDSEIPSTPDDRNGTFHLRIPISAGVSPSDMRRTALPKSSRAAGRKGKEVANEEDEMEDQVPELPVLLTPRRARVEPETQDFPFDPETQNMFATPMDDDVQDSQDDMTPSQQLRSEASQRIRLQATPTPKRNVKSPFIIDDDDNDDDDDLGEPTPKPRYGKGPNPLLANPDLIKAKRRSLPASYSTRTQAPAPQRKSMPGPSHQALKHSSPQGNTTPPAPEQSKSKARELAIAVEYWMSLGYTQHTARQSLEATTWEPGLAGRVMQLLKNGEPMPKNWEGVWTQRDDDGLALIDSAEPPRDDKELKKRKKTTERLINKHGEERIVLRRQWMATKATM